ncbi:hypothetical protein PRZ48_008892 [Zasmidium cellare]|uniref:Uncharacterized protein n=1 Tax=Zasmidium cellare TaxID=395010 RepID=A0ABR0EHM6_ZASCE|nr:hypothetical protein PRZ48_008892 [Zasmidium cellare]
MTSKLSLWLLERVKAAKDLENTTIPTDYSYNRNWQPLRFEDGDVVVKLTRHPSGWLLLNSEVLSRASPVLERSFSERWSRSKAVEHSKSGGKVKVYFLSLIYDHHEGTYFLDSEDSPRGIFQEEMEVSHTPFGPYDPDELAELRATRPQLLSSTTFAPFKCPFPNEDWPEDEFKLPPAQTALDLQSFFAILHGQSPELEDMVVPDSDRLEQNYAAIADDGPDIYERRHVFKHINNVLSYANFYQCFPLVAGYLKRLLVEETWVWEACERYPWLVIKTAEALRWGEMWDDCLRHIFKHHTSFDPDSNYYYATLGHTQETFENTYRQKRVEHDDAVKEMRQGLATTHLPALNELKWRMSYGWEGQRYEEEVFSDHDELSAMIASGIYANSKLARCSQLAYFGPYDTEEYWLRKHATAVEMSQLVSIYGEVLEAAASKNPAAIFKDIKPEDAALKLNYPSIYDTVRMTILIRRDLSHLVRKAARVLKDVFDRNFYTERPELTPARHPSTDYFTNYHITEEDRPWDGPYEWEGREVKPVHGPHQPASEEWLEALGFLELDVTVD